MTKIDLRSQVQSVLPRVNGGTDNELGAANTWVIVRMYNDYLSGALTAGSVVTKTLAIPTLHKCTIASEPIIGVVVGYYPDGGGPLVLGTAPADLTAAIVVSGFVYVQTTAAASVGQYIRASTTAGKATPATAKPAGAFGYCVQDESVAGAYFMIGNVESVGTPAAFTTPAIILGTVAVPAGAATTVIASDSTILAFDATNPTTQAIGDAVATGAAAIAARRDHKHAMPVFGTGPAAVGTQANGASANIARIDHVHATGAGTPTTLAMGDTAAIGSGPAAAMTDHRHGMPGITEILISDTPSTPLVFADLIQNEAQDDLVYSD